MMRGRTLAIGLAVFAFSSILLSWVPVRAQGQVVSCGPLDGVVPSMDGVVDNGEWPATPALSLRTPYSIDTDVYCAYDQTNVYILVDATGDTTEANLDECLLVFDLPPNHKIVEIWQDGGGTIQRRFEGGSAGASDMGHGTHRIYEFAINLVSLGLQAGEAIEFYSPVMVKSPGIWASMPYDSTTTRDNIFPRGLVVETQTEPVEDPHTMVGVSGYAMLKLGSRRVATPALSGWALIVYMGLLCTVGVWTLRSRRIHRAEDV